MGVTSRRLGGQRHSVPLGDTDMGYGGCWDPIQAQNPQQPVEHRRRASWPIDSPKDDRAGAQEGLGGEGVGPTAPPVWALMWPVSGPDFAFSSLLLPATPGVQQPRWLWGLTDTGGPGGWAHEGHPPRSTEPTEDTSPGSEVRGSVWKLGLRSALLRGTGMRRSCRGTRGHVGTGGHSKGPSIAKQGCNVLETPHIGGFLSFWWE